MEIHPPAISSFIKEAVVFTTVLISWILNFVVVFNAFNVSWAAFLVIWIALFVFLAVSLVALIELFVTFSVVLIDLEVSLTAFLEVLMLFFILFRFSFDLISPLVFLIDVI